MTETEREAKIMNMENAAIELLAAQRTVKSLQGKEDGFLRMKQRIYY